MSESATLMYAELLSNIRQISVIAALENACNSATKAELSSDGQHFLLHHDGKVNTLVLPGVASASFRPHIPAPGTKELSWRLPLAGEPETPSVGSTDAPWPARDLNENTEFLCRGCGEVLVAKGHMREWKDLPSENWAEMMDFWHCHKPTIPKPSGPNGAEHSPEDPAMSRGYGANTKFTAQPNIGFVDLTTMLLAEVDCHGVEVGIKKAAKSALLCNGLVTDTHTLDQSAGSVFTCSYQEHPLLRIMGVLLIQSSLSEQSQYKILVCKACKTYIGHQDYQAEGYRIYKWRLKTPLPTSLQFSTPSYYEPSTSSIITSQLQSIMLAQCSSRLLFVPLSWNPSSPLPTSQHLPPSPFPPTFLNLWILNPSLRYSSTASSPLSRHGILAMKIFHRSPSETESAKLLDTESVEEVSLPEETIREIARVLKKSGEELPPNGRMFREWEVGMLERFEG